MPWSFDVTANIPRLNQSGTETGLGGIATAIAAVATVARATAYTTAQMIKPATPTGFWYRCSTAGTTDAVAPSYGTTLGGTTTDGTAVFTAILAPEVRTLGTASFYYMPDFRFNITGTLNNPNPQQQFFVCWDLILSASGSNFNSGTWASDGVTPLYDGLHFISTRVGSNNADSSSGGLQLQIGQFTLIGGEVQLSGAASFSGNTSPKSYYTRWRSAKTWGGVSSTRLRSFASAAVFRGCEFYDIAYDLFVMPTEFSVKARKAEYVAQYVGGFAGGVNAYFKATAIENIDGTYDFDNYSGGYVEIYNCAKGAALNVVTQLPSPNMCTPLYQDVVITAKDSNNNAVPNVRITTTDAPTNSPTATITTIGGLKTWDFINPISYQVTTNASGIGLTSPVLHVWYYASSLKKNLRFPSSTAIYEFRAYNYKTISLPITLGSNSAQQLPVVMNALDTSTVLTETQALALTKFTFVPAGVDGGVVTASSTFTLNELWDCYRAWISQFANRSSVDNWTASGNTLTFGGTWKLVVQSGVTCNKGTTLQTIAANIENAGSLKAPVIGNVIQDPPVDLIGAIITGNLSFNSAVPATIVLTGCSVSGTVSNLGTGLITINNAGSVFGGVGSNISTQLALPSSGSPADIYFSSTTGRTISAKMFAGEDEIGFSLALQEINTTGEYFGFVPEGTPPGTYLVVFYEAGVKLGSGTIQWDGNKEVISVTLNQVEASTVLAKESTLITRASQISVNAIPTNPVLSDDLRLSNLDAAISTRLASSAYIAPDNASIVAIKAKTDILTNGPSLSEIESSTVLSKESTSQAIKAKTDILVNAPSVAQIEASTVLAKQATLDGLVLGNQTEHDATQTAIAAIPTAIQNASAVRTEIATELSKLDVAVGTRLATTDYVAPANADIATIKAKTDLLTFTDGNINSVAQVVLDKTGYELTTNDKTLIVNAMQSAILNETDGFNILEAIVNAIANENISETVLVAAIRDEMERVGGGLDIINKGVMKSSLLIPHSTPI